MLLQDVTKILKVLLGALGAVASPDELTQRRIGQIGEVIGAVGDVSTTEAESGKTIADKRVEEAHDIIHRVAAILAMEEAGSAGEGNNEGGDGDDEPLKEMPWDGTLEGETIELAEEEEE